MTQPPARVWLLFTTRIVRMFAYGVLGVILVLYLAATGLDETRIGVLLTLTFLGDAAITLWLSTRADQWGRRRVLVVGAGLMALGGAVMALTGDFTLLVLGATVGVISPTGGEVGPFLAVEQACLAQVTAAPDRTRIFAWYNVAGYGATALGALAGGGLAEYLQHTGWTALASYRLLLGGYGALGLVIGVMSGRLGAQVEAQAAATQAGRFLGLGSSRGTVFRLSALFSLDSFAGGFIVQSFLAYWLHRRFGVGEAALGAIFLGTNLLSGLSALAAVPLARRIGLVNTMVWTHLPSNVLLMGVPLMPSFGWAVTLLLLRHTISQMDVPTRQSYVNAVVPADERSAANGVTGTARQLGTALAPLFAGPMLGVAALASAPFFVAGGLKIIYDLALWRGFRAVKPPEESA
ncbi:MAG: MFS transporter [Opitutae bacterium]|nr:MFS transporter [Opitutae bacterium]